MNNICSVLLNELFIYLYFIKANSVSFFVLLWGFLCRNQIILLVVDQVKCKTFGGLKMSTPFGNKCNIHFNQYTTLYVMYYIILYYSVLKLKPLLTFLAFPP